MTVPEIYEYAVKNPRAAEFSTLDTLVSSTGALCAYSGLRHGRSPKDKRVVLDDLTKDEIWWGNINIPISPQSNRFCRDIAVKYLNTKRNLYVIDGYAGWDPEYRIKCRIVTTRTYHALFMRNMMIRPTKEELKRDFSKDENIDFHIFNAGELHAPLPIDGLASDTSI